MQDKFCNVSPDGDKITIAVREKSGTAQEITLSFNDANALAMTLPRLLKVAMNRKFADASLRNVYPVREYIVECASDLNTVLLTVSGRDGFDVVFGLDARMVSFLTRDLAGALDLLEARPPILPN
jgi:hypothetical protein